MKSKRWTSLSLAALLVSLLAAASALPLVAEEDEETDVGAQVAAILGRVKVSLAEAATAAEKATKGRAVSAELEIEPDELAYEVVVVILADKEVMLKEVEIDAVTGKVLEVEDLEADDDESDDESDDDESGDDESSDDESDDDEE